MSSIPETLKTTYNICMFSKQIDFLAIGDITTDVFIKLHDARVTCDVSDEHCQICMKFGSKIPYESVTVVHAVGNSANAAVALSRLGLRTALASDIGNDDNGRKCIALLKTEKVGTQYISVHKKMETNYHYVLWYETDHTILVKHQEFPYKKSDFGSPKWVYLSSLGNNSHQYHLEIINWLENNPEIKFAFQPGTFQIELGIEKLAAFYKRSDLFFCNKEEAQRILKTSEEDIKKLMSMIALKGPKIVVITDGQKGAYAYDGMNSYFMPCYPDSRLPYERTGAGDAFSSTFTAAISLGKTIEEALIWAPINAASVVQEIGSQKGLLTMSQLEEWLAKAPAEYRPRKI